MACKLPLLDGLEIPEPCHLRGEEFKSPLTHDFPVWMAGDVLCPSTGTPVQLYNKAKPGLTVLLKHMSFLSKSQLMSHFLN